MNLSRLALLPLLAALAAAAPVQAADQWGGAPARAARPTLADLERAHWIADGRDDAPRKVYVFFDANCKYCTKFWSDARPWVDSGKVQLRYLMVGVISPTSPGKAAALLADPDPAQRLLAYERAHAFGVARSMTGGPHHSFDDPTLPPLAAIPPAIAQQLVANERLMTGLGLSGTPGLVYRGLGGQATVRSGYPPDELPIIMGTP
jgi:thiol:disulfide interchange protein DsbG